MEYASFYENINKKNVNERRWTSSLKAKIKRHKLLTMAGIAFILFSALNFIMIYNFMKILQNI